MLRSGQPIQRSAALVVPLAILVGGAVGCGGSAGAGQRARSSKTTAAGQVAKSGATSAKPASQDATARVDASSDAALAANPSLIAPGAPSDAEIRREIKEARKAGIALPSGDTAASFQNSASGSAVAARGAVPGGAEIPGAIWNPRFQPIADWIVPVLQWAHMHGWTGTVTSGYRTYAEQALLNAAGRFSAPAGYSNHEFTSYPGGAVDVTNPSQLLSVLTGYPGPQKLVGGVLGPVDPEHFSATGR
ncbi:MAG: hypothetical protein E6G56_12075 [Actinobacteria bacterium]|nr:MAG: hypothetical protein E6G56_12075 [Actinomycetota bacterium]